MIHYNMGSKSAIGIGNGICFKQVRDKSGGSYIDPLVRDSLVGVWIVDRNTNESPTRNIIKNRIKDKGGDLELLNFGYKLNSGYGKYEEDFTSWERCLGARFYHNKFTYIEDRTSPVNIISLKINKRPVNSFKIRVEGLPDGQILVYSYFKQENDNERTEFVMKQDGEYILPPSMMPSSTTIDRIGFYNTQYKGNIKGLTITQIPSFEGALVTAGKDDIIVSQKTVQEMLGGSSEYTVLSMIHHIDVPEGNIHSNAVRIKLDSLGTSNKITSVSNNKTGIYGYTVKNQNITVINNILGDKNDYGIRGGGYTSNLEAKFSVIGWIGEDDLLRETASIACYWTVIANKVLTTDQINQVISYFNLDKHVKPDVYYNTIRQGITNENHASFNDELVDFSGNGHNMKIYNSAWNKESGINDEGAWQTDGVTDYGQYVGDLGLKDYTIAVDRAYVEAKPSQVPIMSNVVDVSVSTPFLMEHLGIEKILAPHSFGKYIALSELDINRFISYQSTYKYNGINITKGTSTNTGSGLTIGRIGGVASQYANIALWSLLLFPYSLSEFLLERKLKRHKLGTLYPDMVEFRPVIESNASYDNIVFYYKNKKVENGTYFTADSSIGMHIHLSSNPVNEIKAITVNGVPATFISHDINNNIYIYNFNLTSKPPQKIDITIDEYIRYEDIVQPYPAIINLKQDGKTITWGDKLKVGSDIVFVGSANLLPELYTVSETRYNGVTLYPNTIIKVEKSMVFDNARTYLKANEPSCILSPNRLRIPNSSYKILGYIPDLTGKGNHGRLNNFAYTEESGANEDGSIRFDGTDDHIIIPTIKHGGKCMLMKVNWNKDALILYDQRSDNNPNSFAIYIPDFNNEDSIAYSSGNDGKTYIDGVLNTSVKGSQLKDVTHNITITNSNPNNYSTVSSAIGSNAKHNAFYAQMVLYEFMLFPDVPDEEEIKELNDIVGIEGGYVERPEYY